MCGSPEDALPAAFRSCNRQEHSIYRRTMPGGYKSLSLPPWLRALSLTRSRRYLATQPFSLAAAPLRTSANVITSDAVFLPLPLAGNGADHVSADV